MTIALCVLYFVVLSALSAYGLHRFHLVMLCRRHRARIDASASLAGPALPPADDEVPAVSGIVPRRSDRGVGDAELPRVTIQLPLYNESTVVQRLMGAVAAMDYPRDRLQIQVLDDSSDETQRLASAEVDRLRAEGFDAQYIRRADRVGYKAGALDHGMKTVTGELLVIFDADFLPPSSFCRDLVGHFADPKVAMVQARWAHINREASLLTRVEALMLDGHHLVENRARYGAGHFFNFSGTGGMWRRTAIDDAGGWQHDTLTEDLDLSYRAQLKGWKFIYRPDVISPAEVPEDITAVRAQQYRWAKGTVQTARKMLGRVLRATEMSRAQKVEAFFHLTPHFAYPLLVLLTLLLLPVVLLVDAGSVQTMLLMDAPLCMAPITSLASFYMLAESVQGRSRLQALRVLPALIALGAGLAPHLTVAVREGLRSAGGEFVRTPKRGTNRWRYSAANALPLVELAGGVLMACTALVAVSRGHYFAAPFATLFAFGYFYVGMLMLGEERARRRNEQLATVPAEGRLAAPASDVPDLAA